MKITNKIEDRTCTIRELKPTDVFSLDGEIYMVTANRSDVYDEVVSLETGYHKTIRPGIVVYKLDAELILH